MLRPTDHAPGEETDHAPGEEKEPVKRALVVFACLASVVAVSGCGGGGGGSALSKEDYETQMQALQAKLSSGASGLSSAFSDTSDLDAMGKGLTEAATFLDEASTELADIEPPEDVAEPHQAMIDNTAAAADKIREFVDKLENEPASELQQNLSEFQDLSEFTTLSQAVNDIKAKGYDIGGG
jgi:hypothetical protein